MAQDSGRLTQQPVVAVRGLTRRYGERTIIDNVDLDIGRGEFVALLGRSGSGKSTFLRALAGLDHGVPGSGRLGIPDAVSVVFQDARLLPWKSVVDNVSLGLKGQTPRERALHALAEVELTARAKAWPMQLSGGEQQRAALARSLVREPELLLLDEPFGALDAITREEMGALLLDIWQRTQKTILLVTHAFDEAVFLASDIHVMGTGPARIIETIASDLPYPRSAETYRDPRFGALEARLRELLVKSHKGGAA